MGRVTPPKDPSPTRGEGAPKLRIALVNDYEIVVKGLARMFDSYTDRIEIVELDANSTVAQPVDIALYDTFGQPQGGQAAVAELMANPRVRRAALYTWNLDEDLVRATRRQGVHGYLAKSLTAGEMVDALERIHRGEIVVSPDPGHDAPIIGGDWPGRPEGLSAREAEVLSLITQGLTNKEIADRTYLSPNSVKTYIRAAYQKIGVTRRSQAVSWGIRHGLQPDRIRVSGAAAQPRGQR